MRIRPSLRAPWYQRNYRIHCPTSRGNESPFTEMLGALIRHVDLGQCRALAFNFGKTSEGRFEGMRNASGNGFDSSDSFAVSGAARGPRAFTTHIPSITPSHGDDSHLLSRIASPADNQGLAPEQLAELCRRIRATLLAYGHQPRQVISAPIWAWWRPRWPCIASSISPRRYRVRSSHQSYVRQMLTGRAGAYMDPTVSAR